VGPFKYFRNPLFTPHIGFFYVNTGQLHVNKISQFKNIIEDMTEFVMKLPFQIISFSFDTKVVDMQPFIWAGFKVIPNYTYELSLIDSEESLFANMSSDRRNAIKKAQKDGIFVTETKDFKLIHDLVKKTFDRQSKFLDFEMVNKILNEFANSENAFAYVAYRNELPVAGTFCVKSGSKVYYLLGGYDNKNKHKGAGVLSLWEAILYAKRNGFSVFDFEGSMIQPIESYFRGFGGNIVPYYTVNRACFMLEILLKFKKRQVF
jgi:lipid II:glycine glycyltransferase (peptidoglycan interpeptide bridge formation enzyme)